MFLAITPLARKQDCIALVHQYTLTIHLALLKHTNIAVKLLKIFQFTEAVLLTMAKLADILEVLRVNLAKSMKFTVPEFTLEHLSLRVAIHDSLACAFAVLPLAFVDVSRQEKFHFSMPIRLVKIKGADIDISIAICIAPKSFFDIHLPVACVCFSVLVDMDSYAMLFAIDDFTLVLAPTWLNYFLVVRTLPHFFPHLVENLSEVLLHKLCQIVD